MSRSSTELKTGVVWHGQTRDLARLVESADAHCTCSRGLTTADMSQTCSTHRLLSDQYRLDHLAFARSLRSRLIDEEWPRPQGPENVAEGVVWSAFLSLCASTAQPLPPARARRPSRLALGAWVISIIALLFVLGVHGPRPTGVPPAQPIASWQSR